MWEIIDVKRIAMQEEDDFYKTTYGGFDDEGDDGDFNYNSPQEDDDVVDSDFSIDENEEVKSDPEEDESARKKPKRGDGVQTKAYKVWCSYLSVLPIMFSRITLKKFRRLFKK